MGFAAFNPSTSYNKYELQQVRAAAKRLQTHMRSFGDHLLDEGLAAFVPLPHFWQS
jgi:hypothetical protein